MKRPFFDGHKENFETLRRAFENGDVALLECKDKKTGRLVATLVAISKEATGEFTMVPFARMFSGDPFKQVLPPDPGGGFAK